MPPADPSPSPEDVARLLALSDFMRSHIHHIEKGRCADCERSLARFALHHRTAGAVEALESARKEVQDGERFYDNDNPAELTGVVAIQWCVRMLAVRIARLKKE